MILFLKDERYAAMYFVKVDGAAERPYEGAFNGKVMIDDGAHSTLIAAL